MSGLQELRLRRMLTQRELAERVGVAYQTVQTWESGRNRPQAPKMRRMAEVLDVTPDELLRALREPQQGSSELRQDAEDFTLVQILPSVALTEAQVDVVPGEATALWESVTDFVEAHRDQWGDIPPAAVAKAILEANERVPGGKAKRTQAVARLLVKTKRQAIPFVRWLLSVAEELDAITADRANKLLNPEPVIRRTTTPRRRKSPLERALDGNHTVKLRGPGKVKLRGLNSLQEGE